MTTTPNPVLPMPPQNKHERTYTLLLAIFTFSLTVGAGAILLVVDSPQIDETTRLAIRLSAYIEACYAAAAVFTLIFRLGGLAYARLVTKAMNIVLLACFPFGTALGIYGLWKLRPSLNQS